MRARILQPAPRTMETPAASLTAAGQPARSTAPSDRQLRRGGALFGFNQMLGIPIAVAGKRPTHVADAVARDLDGRAIAIADHCYGCTAGQGSSCGGALA